MVKPRTGQTGKFSERDQSNYALVLCSWTLLTNVLA